MKDRKMGKRFLIFEVWHYLDLFFFDWVKFMMEYLIFYLFSMKYICQSEADNIFLLFEYHISITLE